MNRDFYSKAKIYKLIDNTNDDIFIGSTCKSLSQALSGHKNDYRKYSLGLRGYINSFKILENNNYDIILIEECKDIKNVNQLNARKRHFIDSTPNINKVMPNNYSSEHIEETKRILKEKARTKYTCACGAVVCHDTKKKHEATKKHIIMLEHYYDDKDTTITF